MSLCDDAADWHAIVAAEVAATDAAPVRPGGAGPVRALRRFVARELGPAVLRSHDWSFTAGTGAVLDHLLRVLRAGALLPTYQRVARATAATPEHCVWIPPQEWSTARFQPPRRPPEALIVNALHANPSAATLPVGFLTDLVEHARRHDVLLVEDDAFRGTAERDSRHPALLHLAAERTVHLGSFTKQLGWPAKAGFVGWPRAMRDAAGLCPPGWTSASTGQLAAVLSTGRAETLRALRRRRFAQRRRDLLMLLDRRGVRYVAPSGGLHVAVRADTVLLQRLHEHGIGGLAGAEFSAAVSRPPMTVDFVRLGLSNVSDAAWPALLSRLDRVLYAGQDTTRT